MRTRSFFGCFALAGLAAVGAACSATGPDQTKVGGGPTPSVVIAPDVKLLPEPVSEPEDLPGVDTANMTPRERKAFWKWVSQLYAPCKEVATSIATCVKEDRACSTCLPAAQFLAQRARMGSPQNETIAAFNVRFGPDVKKIDESDSPSRGPANAPVTLVVWSDFECPACGFAVPYLDELIEKHATDVRLVHKLYPLKSHLHSRAAARASIAARRQNKYWEMEKQLFANQKHLEDQDLEEYARNAGLDMNKYAKDIADPKVEEIIERDIAEADKQGLTGTPFILINGREFDLGFFRLDKDLEPWIVSEAAAKRKEAEKKAIQGLGSTLSGDGKGPVGPAGIATGVPASSGVPAAGAAPANSGAPAAGAAPANSGAPAASNGVPAASNGVSGKKP